MNAQMDPRLLEAAQKGDVDLLNDLINSNGLILQEAALREAGHTPLHVACIAGHSNFVRELLKFMPKLVGKVNADGYSPLHIAAAGGDVELVREILKAGRSQDLCLVKGRERRIPLHCAAANGEVSAMKELLSASPESIEETTAREETALHLSVKNNRFYALFVLVEHLKQHNKEQVINWKDKKGDTILHLAVATKNFEVVDFILSGHALKCEVIELNALNESGSTPLDVLSDSDRDIGEILERAGAKPGQSKLPFSEIIQMDEDKHNIKGTTSNQSVMKPASQNDHQPSAPPKDSNQGLKLQGETRSDLLVVAVLIASANYQAVLQPITLPNRFQRHTKKGFLAAYLSFCTSPFSTNAALCLLLISNTFGFYLSVYMIYQLTVKLPLRVPLLLSTLSMVLTYLNCMMNVPVRSLLEEDFSLLGNLLINIMAILVPVVLLLLTTFLQNKLENVCAKAAGQFKCILEFLGVYPQKSSSRR